jgi:hypothetical protein
MSVPFNVTVHFTLTSKADARDVETVLRRVHVTSEWDVVEGAIDV